jgi:hypothetical protein
MKTLLYLAILFSTIEYPSDYVLIEHVGWSDKPIFTVLISYDKHYFYDDGSFDDFIRDNSIFGYEIRKKQYFALKDSVVELCGDTVVDRPYDYGTFRVSVYENENKSFECIIIKEEALNIFPKLVKAIEGRKKNNDLVIELEKILRRLR